MTALEFVTDYMNNHPDNIDEDTGQPYFDTVYSLLCEIHDPIYSENAGDSRWWSNLFQVQEINGKLIGFEWAVTTGDRTPYECGWKFDEKSICFVESYDVTVTKYQKIEGQ